MSCASFSLSFLHNACGDSKKIDFQFRPKLVTPIRVLTVEAKAKTRREDRTARHIRIRKKVNSIYSVVFWIIGVLNLMFMHSGL